MAKPILLPNLDAPDDGVVSTHEIVRFLAGELAPARRAELDDKMAKDAAFKARVDAIDAEQKAADAAFKVEVPLARFLDEHEARTASPLARLLKSVRFQAGIGVLVASAAAVLFLVKPAGTTGPDEVAYDGLKGGARVGFFVKDEEGARFGRAGEELTAGDRIQFAVKDDATHPSMVLVGIDGRGSVTTYVAENVDGDRPKGPVSDDEKPRVLPASVVLDDSTGPERFFVVYGDGSLDDVRRTVEDAAKSLAATSPNLVEAQRLALPAGWVQSSVHIVKVK
jgi:hypothetical protein